MFQSTELSFDNLPSNDFFYSRQNVFQNTFKLNIYDLSNPLYNKTSCISLHKKKNLPIFGSDYIASPQHPLKENTQKTVKKSKKIKLFDDDIDTSVHYFEKISLEKSILQLENQQKPQIIKQTVSPNFQNKNQTNKSFDLEQNHLPVRNSHQSAQDNKSKSAIFSPLKKPQIDFDENPLISGFYKNHTQKNKGFSPPKIRKFELDSKVNDLKSTKINNFSVLNEKNLKENVSQYKEDYIEDNYERLNEIPQVKKTPKNQKVYSGGIFIEDQSKPKFLDKKGLEKMEIKKENPFFKGNDHNKENFEENIIEETPKSAIYLNNFQTFPKQNGDRSISSSSIHKEKITKSPILEKERFLKFFEENDKGKEKKGLSESETSMISKKGSFKMTIFSELEKMKTSYVKDNNLVMNFFAYFYI